MSRKLEINTLGPLQVKVGEDTAVFRTDALRVLLAYLAAHQGMPQRRDTLAGLLSPDRPDKGALTYLRNRLTRLRKAIGDDTAVPPYLDVDRKQITLRSGDDVLVDLTQFAQCLAKVEAHAHRQLAGCPTCLARLETAVSLVRGELLAGLNFPSEPWQTWLTAQREHVQQQALAAMTQLRDARMQLGEWTAVRDIAQRQLSLEPWLEAAHRALMLAHDCLGDRNAALAQFEQCEQMLRDELGVAPEEETVALFEKIRVGEDDLASSVIRHLSAVPHNLPRQLTPFVGREAEQAQLLQYLVDPAYRLVTLTGTGGIGKTRLALEVGRQVQASFPDGVWFVSLEAMTGGEEQIKIAVGDALGLSGDGKQLSGAQVLAILRQQQLLLILDNCEVALDALGFLPTWLRRAPHVAVLATSREPLNFQAESVVALDGLPPGAAAALFAERAQMARADFAVTTANTPQVGQICALVDGSPLGITLAAAWVRRRSLTQIIAGIGQSLDFLSTRLRDVDARHRSVRAVFEASWQLLAPAEQNALAALSLFPGSFTAVAAEAVAGATIFDLDALCEKSLLQQQQESERYGMHSLVRHFAAEKLGEGATAVAQAFVAYFAQFARDHRSDLATLQPEWGNLLTAVQHAHALAAWQTVLDLANTLYQPWKKQLRLSDIQEGTTLAVEAATRLNDPFAAAQNLLRLGENEVGQNRYEAAETHINRALENYSQLEDGLGIAHANYLLGRIQSEQGQDEQALQLFAYSRQIFEDENNPMGIARNLNYMADCLIGQDPTSPRAKAYLEESITLLRSLPPSPAYVEALLSLARIYNNLGTFATAEAHLIEATRASQGQDDLGNEMVILFERMFLSRKLNQLDAALSFGQDCLQIAEKIGSLRWQGLVKTQLGLVYQAQESHDNARRSFHQSLQIFEELGDLFEQALCYYCLHTLHADSGEPAKSLHYKQEAIRLNEALKNGWLADLLQ